MVEPTTVNKALIVPNTGDLVGAWGTSALNPDFVAIDGMLGGFAILSLSSATTIALSAPSGSITPSAGPTQQQNALLKFTGTLTGNAVIQFTLPGFYIVDNRCTVGAFSIQLAPSAGTGTVIGAPPGRKAHIFFDGTNVDYIDMPEVGSALDLHGATAVPPWMTACSVLPYLIKDGSTYSTSVYPALGVMLGSTFGGNGITTFGVPDERARFRLAFDTGNTGRVTSSSIVGGATTMGATGGDQLLQAHIHTTIDPGHTHPIPSITQNVGAGGIGASFIPSGGGIFGTAATNTTGISIATTGGGIGQNMPPVVVSFLPLIKT